MKFSVLSENQKVTLPARDQLGDWIVKLDSARFPNLVENEYATMSWAEQAGFDVPERRVEPITALPDSIASAPFR